MLQFKPEEIAAIIKDFEEPGTLAPTGLFLGGTKYMVIQGEPTVVIRGKKVQFFFEETMAESSIICDFSFNTHVSFAKQTELI
jgi:hypothetical protein